MTAGRMGRVVEVAAVSVLVAFTIAALIGCLLVALGAV